jgi:hypothetical protein
VGGPDLGEGIDLLIHGVSGTRPEAMLDVQDVVRVGGNRLSGFYRRNPEILHVQDAISRRPVEAFSWGGFTSGAASRALWLLLLPFGLVSAASWMHPAVSDRATPWRDPLVRRYQAILRLLALSLTVMFFVAGAGLAMDMLAWKSPRAATDLTRPLAFGSGALTVVLGLMWWLSRRTWKRYDATPDTGSTPVAASTPLMNGAFWSTKQTVRRLRLAHVMAGSATIVAWTTGPLALEGLMRPGSTVCAVASLVLLGAAIFVSTRSDLGSELDGVPVRTRFLAWVSRASFAFSVGVVVWVSVAPAVPITPRPEPAFHRVLTGTIAAQVVILLALLAVTLRSRPAARASADAAATSLHGLIGPAFAAVAWITGGLFATAITVGGPFAARDLPRWAHAPAFLTNLGRRAQQPDVTFSWESLNALVVLAVLIVSTIVVVRRHDAPHRAGAPAAVAADYGPGLDAATVRRLARLRIRAGVTDAAPVVVAPVTIVGVVAMSVGLVASITGLRPPQVLAVISAAVVAAATLLLVVGGYYAFKRDGIRRVVGIVWDLATFWPRAVHPFAPPCYGERAVPQLLERIRAASSGGGAVLLSAHSQGTVIGAAVALRLTPGERECVALLTYGSPLRRLYSSMFPAYFGPSALADLAGMLGAGTPGGVRWRNVWRPTDPIGGPIAGPTDDTGEPRSPVVPALAGVDVRLPRDPAELRVPGDIDDPPAERHSNYARDPGFVAASRHLDDMLLTPPAG